MTCTEIFGITKDSAFDIGETRNSWRGAMAVWTILEKRYLPKYIPDWVTTFNQNEEYSRITAGMLGGESELKKIWDLFKDSNVSETDRIVLGSTFDNVLVKTENVSKLLKAYREFEGETSLKDQADLIEEAIKEDPKIVAIGWNQTSVNADTWGSVNYNEKTEEYKGYNIKKDNKHWFLFDKLEKENKSE